MLGLNTTLNKDALTDLYSKTNASISTLTTVVDNSSSSTSNTNNHLTRSTTPLQLAESKSLETKATSHTSSVFDPFGTITTKKKSESDSDHFSTIKSTSSFVTGPTDFKDDPFKDYRYEDPFNIKDPFDDDDDEFATDPDKVFKDDVVAGGVIEGT